jgi:hypothetical protein
MNIHVGGAQARAVPFNLELRYRPGMKGSGGQLIFRQRLAVFLSSLVQKELLGLITMTYQLDGRASKYLGLETISSPKAFA